MELAKCLELIKPILDITSLLWDFASRQSCYICGLEKTLTSLRKKIKELTEKRDDVKMDVQSLEVQGMTRTNEVNGWLTRVEEKETEVNDFLSGDGNIGSDGSTCLKIYRCRSSYNLGKKSTKLLNDVQDLISTGVFSVFANQQEPYVTGREDNVNSLISEMTTLNARSIDVKRRVRLAEQDGKVQTVEVTNWLQLVDEMGERVKKIDEDNAQLSGSGLPPQCVYMVGRRAKEALDDVKNLFNRGDFKEVAAQLPRLPLISETKGLWEIPMRNQNSLGFESTLEKVREGLRDHNVGIIGLYGMGGVGKSTLLKTINNMLLDTGDDAFDWAFWVEASRNQTIGKIQEQIMRTLRIPYETLNDNSIHGIRNEIYNTVQNGKYILLLDDVWEMIDLLEEVGLPDPHHLNKNKIIFTTRSEHVCYEMRAKLRIKVECLPWKEAWSFFKENVGNSTISNHIESCAKKVAMECQGLPLALKIIGLAMCGKRDPHIWSSTLQKLQNCPQDFKNLEEKVFHVLKLSYDFLDEINQQCFLYCSLFPEGSSIAISKLIYLWMGERYLNGEGDIGKVRDKGYEIINDLMSVCLLEKGNDIESVKMHDMIRDMALMVAKDRFLYCEKIESMRAKNNDRSWNNEGVEKMSLWGTRISLYKEEASSSQREQEEFKLTRECPKLSTLLCQLSPRVNLSELFNFMLKVTVVDLSESFNITSLPEVVSKLENLQYLDISKTGIRRLSNEMKCLSKLRYLLMSSMLALEEFPIEIISSLKDLLVFRMDYSAPFPEELLGRLEELENIQEISICLDSAATMNCFLNSRKLQSCATFIELRNTSEEFEWCPTKMKNLEFLLIKDTHLKASKCSNLTNSSNAFNNLHYVEVLNCDLLVDLDILAYAPCLVKLRVGKCRSIQRILHLEKADVGFFYLKEICLYDLQSLQIICNKPLSFPTLEKIDIEDCPKLQNPFNDMMPNNNNLREIKADKDWWNSVQWINPQQHYSQFLTANN